VKVNLVNCTQDHRGVRGNHSIYPTNSFDGVTVVNGSPFTIKDVTSHDVKLGVRWNFESEQPVYAPPPLVRKG